MFERLVRLGPRFPRATTAAAFLVVLVAGVLALLLDSRLPAGGYGDPGSESARADRVLGEHFDTTGMPVVFRVTADAGADSPLALARAADVVRALTESGVAGRVVSYADLPPGDSRSALLSTDGRTGLVTARIAGDDGTAPERAADIAGRVSGARDGVEVDAGGQAIVYHELNEQNLADVTKVELIAVPITLLVLIWVFGSAVAALIPIVIALFSSVCTVAVLRVLAGVTDVSIFALSVASPLCLALAIDYTLFVITRYREELAGGAPRAEALARTLATTGRTVAYSAVTVAVSLAMMMLFPIYFLRSVGYAGLVGVALSAVGALVVAPAVIALLGDRVDSWDLRRPVRRLFRRPPPRLPEPEETFWYRSTRFVMRYAVPASLLMVAVFVALATPFLGVRFGYPDDRVLPGTATSRQVGDDLRADFTRSTTGEVEAVLPDVTGVPADALADYGARLSAVPDVAAVSGPGGTYVGGRKVQDTALAGGVSDAGVPAAHYVVGTVVDPVSERAADQLRRLEDVPAPADALFTGVAKHNLDNVEAITSRVPLVLALIAAVSFVLLFLFTGSVLMPLKALVMNVLSLTAAFGALVWVFQDGRLDGLGTTATGALTVSIPPLIFCVAFGLSMDYEVFMLSRVREEWVRSAGTAADNERSVAVGLARTGRLITTAAALMAVVFAALATAQVSFVRMLGVGLTLTVLLDAFLIRLVLVPSVMRLAGGLNWWAPRGLRRWHARHGFTD